MIGLGDMEIVTAGGQKWTQITAAAVIKAKPGRLCKLVVIAPGTTSGSFVFNDCAATSDAATGNEIFTLAYNAAANVAGLVVTLEWPCAVGIVCSAVPGGGSPVINVSWA